MLRELAVWLSDTKREQQQLMSSRYTVADSIPTISVVFLLRYCPALCDTALLLLQYIVLCSKYCISTALRYTALESLRLHLSYSVVYYRCVLHI
jgi:hypothetical protein